MAEIMPVDTASNTIQSINLFLKILKQEINDIEFHRKIHNNDHDVLISWGKSGRSCIDSIL